MNREEPMIFFCFCEKDRLPLVNDFFRFLSNFGLSILYDRGNIFLGDEHYTNIEIGVNNPEIKYAVIFYSDNFKNRNICLEEFNTLCQRREKENLCLFPVFLGSCTEQIDAQFEICKKLVYKELFDYDGFAGLALHIIAKITTDEVQSMPFQTLEDVFFLYPQKDAAAYKLLMSYSCADCENYSMRIGILYCIFETLRREVPNNYIHFRTMNYIFHQNCVKSFTEESALQIMENIVTYSFGLICNS